MNRIRVPTLATRPRPAPLGVVAVLGLVALAVLVAWWAWRALHDPLPWDAGLAYNAGQVAWATGHPEHLGTWTGMPFLAATMALLGRAVNARTAADLVTVLNAVMAAGAVTLVLYETRHRLTRTWWWIAAFGLLSFAPLMSSAWSKQFNVIVLVLAIGGFELVRRRRVSTGAALIGLSVALKPMVILLPVVLLAGRQTRRAGATALAWIAGLNLAAQAWLAVRAHDLAALDPLIALRNFLDKSHPSFLVCVNWNFAPGATLCRLVGLQHWALQRVAVLSAVLLLSAWVFDALRGHPTTSWAVFAFVCPLSAMLSPLAWTHYQILLAPLFFLLLYRFSRDGASVGAWAGLAVAFVLASLVWQPYGTILGAVHGVVSGAVRAPHEPTFVEGFAQFAQYVLLLTGVIWYLGRRRVAP